MNNFYIATMEDEETPSLPTGSVLFLEQEMLNEYEKTNGNFRSFFR